MTERFERPTKADLSCLARMRADYICVLGLEDPSDLSVEVLQNAIDRRLVAPEDIYRLQCLGVALGDLFCLLGEFEWRMIDDEHGRDPTIASKSRVWNLNALTVISKRVEAGEAFDVAGFIDFALTSSRTKGASVQ